MRIPSWRAALWLRHFGGSHTLRKHTLGAGEQFLTASHGRSMYVDGCFQAPGYMALNLARMDGMVGRPRDGHGCHRSNGSRPRAPPQNLARVRKSLPKKRVKMSAGMRGSSALFGARCLLRRALFPHSTSPCHRKCSRRSAEAMADATQIAMGSTHARHLHAELSKPSSHDARIDDRRAAFRAGQQAAAHGSLLVASQACSVRTSTPALA